MPRVGQLWVLLVVILFDDNSRTISYRNPFHICLFISPHFNQYMSKLNVLFFTKKHQHIFEFNLSHICRNPSHGLTTKVLTTLTLGLVTKVKVYKVVGQEWSPRVTFHAPRRLRVWESGRIEPPHSQVNSDFGSWSPDRLSNFQKVIVRVKTHWIEEFFISLESSWNLDV